MWSFSFNVTAFVIHLTCVDVWFLFCAGCGVVLVREGFGSVEYGVFLGEFVLLSNSEVFAEGV